MVLPDDPPIVLPEWPAPPGGAAYRGLPGEIVRTIEPESEADPVALLVQLLIAYGNVIGRRARTSLSGRGTTPTNSAVMVGETSAGSKGQSLADARSSSPLADPDWHNGRILGGLSSGKG